MNIRSVIVEDEPLAARYLNRMLGEINEDIEVVSVLDSMEDALAYFRLSPKVDLIFMDIELGDGQSFEIFNHIKPDTPIIFVTAYKEHALKAFKSNGIDYLLKPVNKEELSSALTRFKRHYYDRSVSSFDIASLINAMPAIKDGYVTYKKRYLARAGTRLISLNAAEIAFFYIRDKVQFIKTKTGKDYMIDKRMEEIEADMDPATFFRVNRQFILSYECIQKVHTWFGGKLKIETLPLPFEDVILGRLKAGDFKKWLGE